MITMISGIFLFLSGALVLSAGMEISCPSAWTLLSGYMEYELSVLRSFAAIGGRPIVILKKRLDTWANAP